MDAQLNNCFSNFRFYVLLTCLFSLAATSGNASEPVQEKDLQKKDPEVVYVAVEQASLYAGPSTDFYPTSDARRGTVLDVYQRTQNGWLGVRPPQGSFSWVPASQAYLLPGGRVIEITDGNSVSWIGTDLGSAKQYRWQVQLRVGEQLSVLGEDTIKSDTDEREALWYRVAPPAGEFRWIEEAAVSKSAPPVTPSAAPGDAATVSKPEVAPTTPPATPSGSNKIVANKNLVEKSVVQPASFEKPATAATRNANHLKPNAERAKGKPSTSADNQWDGWYAFEMSDSGVRTPFLDKLSGRDRGQSSRPPKSIVAHQDPLLHDPFSLTMAGQPQKPLPSELNEIARKQRDWRDPQSLRDARIAGSIHRELGPSASRRDDNMPMNSSPTNSPEVQLASSDNSQSFVTTGAVNTAGYDRRVAPSVDSARANVNWYGLNEGTSNIPNSSASGSALGVMTSTADVGELQLSLNHTVASSNGPWNLAPLAERARYLIEHGPTALDRGQARLLLERIEAFQNVSARTQQVSGTAPLQTNPVQSTSFNAATHNLTLPNAVPGAAATYEATGWLVPVHAAGPDQPTHALTNDTGDVVAYVSPIAGLNLDRYRNQAVGINGLRGYLPQLQAAHIQAQRVSRVR